MVAPKIQESDDEKYSDSPSKEHRVTRRARVRSQTSGSKRYDESETSNISSDDIKLNDSAREEDETGEVESEYDVDSGPVGDDDDEEEEENQEEDEDIGIDDEPEEDEEVPSISDDEYNYKLEDPEEIDEDLELRDEEEQEAPIPEKHVGIPNQASRSLRPQRETRKRQLALYGEDGEEETEYNDSDEIQIRQSKRKSRRPPETRTGQEDIDKDLLLTDEENEYNPQANPDVSKMTERQRLRFVESGDKKEFLELTDDNPILKRSKPKSVESDKEIAQRKAESARRRQDYKNKVLEEEKRDTLNKLLKRRANKTRENEGKEGSAESSKLTLKPRRPMLGHPAFFRWISNTTSLSGDSVLGFNSGV